MTNAIRAATVTFVLSVLAMPAVAAPAMGVPDAPPPVERVIAREDGLRLPDGLQAPDGEALPAGLYDLALIECGGRYFLQVTSRETRRGFRLGLQPQVGAALAALAPSSEATASMRFDQRSLLVTRGGKTTEFPLGGSATAG